MMVGDVGYYRGKAVYGQCDLCPGGEFLYLSVPHGSPNAMVLEHPDEFVHEVRETIRASVEKAKK